MFEKVEKEMLPVLIDFYTKALVEDPESLRLLAEKIPDHLNILDQLDSRISNALSLLVNFSDFDGDFIKLPTIENVQKVLAGLRDYEKEHRRD